MAAPSSIYGREAMAFFDELKKADAGNAKCVDCGINTPLWASLSYGTYFCLECSGVHRNLGVHISFVRSLNMDSWSAEQQARMRAGGNTAFREYMRGCGMPEALQSGGGAYVGRESQAEGAIREKYHTTSAAAYKAWLADRARGDGPPAPPRLAYAPPPPPPNYNAPRPPQTSSGPPGGINGTSSFNGRTMQGFGSQGFSSTEPDGLDALMASLGSGLGSARSALASYKSAAIPALGSAVEAVRASETLGSVAERAKRAAALARGKLEEAASFNAQRDLAHLSAGLRPGGNITGGGFGGAGSGGCTGGRSGNRGAASGSSGVGSSSGNSPSRLNGCGGYAAPEQDSLGFGAVAGSVLSAGLGLWGRARAAVEETVSFDASADLAHLARPSRQAGPSAAGGFGGFGGGEHLSPDRGFGGSSAQGGGGTGSAAWGGGGMGSLSQGGAGTRSGGAGFAGATGGQFGMGGAPISGVGHFGTGNTAPSGVAFGCGGASTSTYTGPPSADWQQPAAPSAWNGTNGFFNTRGGTAATSTSGEGAATADGWGDDTAGEGAAADGWGDDTGGWGEDEAEPSHAVAPPRVKKPDANSDPMGLVTTSMESRAQPPQTDLSLGPETDVTTAVESAAKPSAAKASKGAGWNDTSWADADDW